MIKNSKFNDKIKSDYVEKLILLEVPKFLDLTHMTNLKQVIVWSVPGYHYDIGALNVPYGEIEYQCKQLGICFSHNKDSTVSLSTG